MLLKPSSSQPKTSHFRFLFSFSKDLGSVAGWVFSLNFISSFVFIRATSCSKLPFSTSLYSEFNNKWWATILTAFDIFVLPKRILTVVPTSNLTLLTGSKQWAAVSTQNLFSIVPPQQNCNSFLTVAPYYLLKLQLKTVGGFLWLLFLQRISARVQREKE